MAVPVSEQRKLLQRSGGVCAFPRCRRALTTHPGTVDAVASLGQIAHIVAESVDGPRGASPLSPEERSECRNLILLCAHHHALIDAQPGVWTVPRLIAMKQAHERWVQRRLGAADPVSGEATAGGGDGEDFVEWFLRSRDDLQRADAEIDRALLGIHAALPLPPGSGPGLSPQLPAYVPRDLDGKLRDALAEQRVHSGFLLLVGPAASGKTRCAYEGVRAVVPDWSMLLPPSAGDLTSLVNAGVPLGSTVIWLDDLPRFLGPGTLTARTVRRLLIDRSEPVILVGTIWPADYERLMTRTGTETGQDISTEAQQILLLAHRFDVAEQFTPAERARAGQIALTDPRIREAPEHAATGTVPSVLACAPELIHRWDQPADTIGGAVITAAVEARLCGHPAVIPPGLLQRLTEEYLTPAQRATASPGWFDAGIAWACRPVRASIAPVAPSARRIGELDGYEVSDILVHHGIRRYSRQQRVPVTPWDVLTEHSALDACKMVGLRAMYYGLNATAARALRRVAETGATETMVALAMAYLDEDDFGNAQRWFLAAAEAGDAMAMAMLAVLLQQQGDAEGAREWLRHGAEAGDTGAMVGYGRELEKDGDLAAARGWYEKSTETGDNGQGMVFLGCMLRGQGDLRVALGHFLRAAESARSFMDDHLRSMPVPAGAAGGAAARKYRDSVTRPYAETALCLGETYKKMGNASDARTWLEQAAGLGHVRAMTLLGSMLWESGEFSQALTWLRPAAEAGEPEAMFYLGMILDLEGHYTEAGTWLERAAGSGTAPAMGRYALFLAEQGDHEGAREWGAKARDAGDPYIDTLLAAQDDTDNPPASPEAPDGLNGETDPDQIAWTPLAHACGCVTDWGWDAAHTDPVAFVNWCTDITEHPCPWHASDPSQKGDLPRSEVIVGLPDGGGPAFYARPATGDDIVLGRQLAVELAKLRQLVVNGDIEAILIEIPTAYRNWMDSNGYDPAETWIQQRLADLILNRGQSMLPGFHGPAE